MAIPGVLMAELDSSHKFHDIQDYGGDFLPLGKFGHTSTIDKQDAKKSDMNMDFIL